MNTGYPLLCMLYLRFNLHRVTFSYLLNSSACSHLCLLYLLTLKLTHLHLLTLTYPRVPSAPLLHTISLTYTYKCKWTVEVPLLCMQTHAANKNADCTGARVSFLSRVSLLSDQKYPAIGSDQDFSGNAWSCARYAHGHMELCTLCTWARYAQNELAT